MYLNKENEEISTMIVAEEELRRATDDIFPELHKAKLLFLNRLFYDFHHCFQKHTTIFN